MFTGLYTSASGLLAQMKNMDMISNNLANINTSGFRKDRGIFRTFYDDAINSQPVPLTSDGNMLANKDSNSMVVIERAISDFSDGIVKETGNPLDLAIVGNGFFELQDAGGKSYFTRSGSFQLNEAGEMVNPEGYKLMGEFGPIIIEAGSGSIYTKDITFDEKGVLSVGEEEVGQLSIAKFVDNNELKKIGNSLFTNANAENFGNELFDGTIVQRHLEMSNVNPVEEMANMITTTRAFEAYQKVLRAVMDDTADKAINTVGRNR